MNNPMVDSEDKVREFVKSEREYFKGKDVVIPRGWLERLVELADQYEEKHQARKNTILEEAMLIGYISSAKTILKYK